MEPTQQSQESVVEEAQKLKDAQQLKVDVNVDQPGAIIKSPPPAPSTDQPWQEWVQVVSEFLSKFPDYVGDFFSSYQKPLITLTLLVSGVITVKVTLAVLDAINDIPLLAPVFELVGIGYSAWFVYRYLLRVETRQELGNEFKALKGQVVGKD
ncbi:MAG TPA: CAAD domain-containing protein [Coleofasciculaceae cyanobacterium]